MPLPTKPNVSIAHSSVTGSDNGNYNTGDDNGNGYTGDCNGNGGYVLGCPTTK